VGGGKKGKSIVPGGKKEGKGEKNKKTKRKNTKGDCQSAETRVGAGVRKGVQIALRRGRVSIG